MTLLTENSLRFGVPLIVSNMYISFSEPSLKSEIELDHMHLLYALATQSMPLRPVVILPETILGADQ